jgi:hypothetical protein
LVTQAPEALEKDMADQLGISDLVRGIQQDVTAIVHDEIELAKAELMPQIKKAGIGAGLFGVAGYLAVSAGALAFLTVSLWLSAGFSVWFALEPLWALSLGFTTVTVVALLAAGLFAVFGYGQFSFAKPEKTISQAEKTVAALKGKSPKAATLNTED